MHNARGAMNTTFIVLSLGVAAYLGSCALNWRRLTRGDPDKEKPPKLPLSRR
jgi:hypothetical protein